MKKRIAIIDEVRGLLIILVVAYHALYNLAVIFNDSGAREVFDIAIKYQPILPFMFILISGISFSLSRSNLKRGLKLAAVALAISLILFIFMRDQMIWFGIIHFLALANIVLSPLKKQLDKIPAALGIVLCILLFALTYNVQRGYVGIDGLFRLNLPDFLYSTDALAVFGFYGSSFSSADYNPILPWIFAFLLGVILGRYAQCLPESLKKTHIRPLAFVGRHTLIIYIVHQPLLYGIMWLAFR